jgi:hypothetical protein
VRHESRVAAIKQRLKGSRAVRIHSRYIKRQFRSIAGADAGSFAGGLGALLRWLNRRARRRRWRRPRLWRRYVATHVEMHRRYARLQRIYRRRVCRRPQTRVRWVIEGYSRSDRANKIFPPQKLGNLVVSRRARIHAWLALERRAGSA